MTVFTLGFTQKNAETFFNLIKDNGVELVLDIRLNNASQLAGFTKGDDLKYFLKNIAGCDYAHDLVFAPAKEIFDGYRDKKITWGQLKTAYKDLMAERNAVEHFQSKYSQYNNVCLLCSEAAPEKCHRRLLAEILKQNCDDIGICHLL